MRPILAHNYPEGNISLDQKLAEYHGASTRFPSMTLEFESATCSVSPAPACRVPSIDMQAAYRAMFYEDTPQQKISARSVSNATTVFWTWLWTKPSPSTANLVSRTSKNWKSILTRSAQLEGKIQQQEPWIKPSQAQSSGR